MRIEVGAATDIGRARERNEDGYLVDAPTFAVADGMGGHKGGEVASALALEILGEKGHGGREVGDAIREANRAVFERSLQDRNLSGMGTTLTAVVAEGSRLRVAHVGDSRAYLLRDGGFTQLTHDHTLVARMVSEGQLTEEEAAVHPQRSILTRALGVDSDVVVDEDLVDVRPGDRLLLCTDGLTGMVDEEEIGSILTETPEPQRAAERLVKVANDAGGYDNITALVLDVREEETSDETASDAPAATAAGETSTAPGEAADEGPMPPARGRRPFHDDGGVEAETGRSLPVRLALYLGLPLFLLVLAFVGVRLYVDSQWYVGVDEGQVAIFRGVPAELGGFELHEAVDHTGIPASLAESSPLWRGRLEDGVTVNSREEAEEVVRQIRDDLAVP